VLTPAQWNLPAVQIDLANYSAFLATNPGVNQTYTFHFGAASGGLTVAGWQNLNLQISDPVQVLLASGGVEGSPIPLSLSTAISSFPGNSLSSLVINAIPVGSTLSDGNGHSFTATSGNTSVDVHGWTCASLKITPPNDTNFTLSLAVTKADGSGTGRIRVPAVDRR
jgi:hypothetical protein